MPCIAVGAVQFSAEPCQRERNLACVGGWIARAAADGAKLVCLPELTPGGYLLTPRLWDSAEPREGPSMTWLRATAHRHGLYLGMSYLEAEGEHFYNTFVLVGPDGETRGRVRKNPPASAEACFFAPGTGAHAVDTELGRVGVMICYEALLHERLAELHSLAVDLVLIPMSAATPTPTFPIRRKDGAAYDAMLAGLAAHHAGALGVPVVMANKCGPLVTDMPMGLPRQDTYFPGLSTIADSDGSIRARLAGEQGFAVAEVVMEPTRRRPTPPKPHRRWSLPVPWFSFLFPLAARLGAREYARSRERAAAALAASGGA